MSQPEKNVFQQLTDAYAISLKRRQAEDDLKKQVTERKIDIVQLKIFEPLTVEQLILMNRFLRVVNILHQSGRFKHLNLSGQAVRDGACQDITCVCSLHYTGDPCVMTSCSCGDHYSEHVCHPDNGSCRLFPPPKGHADYRGGMSQWDALPLGYVACLATGKLMSREVHVCHAACSFIVRHETRGIYCSKSGHVVDTMVLAHAPWNSSRGGDDDHGGGDPSDRFERIREQHASFTAAMNEESAKSKVEMVVKMSNQIRKRKMQETKDYVISRMTKDYCGPKFVPLPTERERKLMEEEDRLKAEKDKENDPSETQKRARCKKEEDSGDNDESGSEDEDGEDKEQEEEGEDDEEEEEEEEGVVDALQSAYEQEKKLLRERSYLESMRCTMIDRLRQGNAVVGSNPVQWRQLNNVRIPTRDLVRHYLTNTVKCIVNRLVLPKDLSELSDEELHNVRTKHMSVPKKLTEEQLSELVIVCSYNYLHMRQLHEDEMIQRKKNVQNEQCAMQGVASPSLLSNSSSPGASPLTSFVSADRAKRLHVFCIEKQVAATIRLLCNPNAMLDTYEFMKESNFHEASSWRTLIRVTSESVSACTTKLQDALLSRKFLPHTPFSVKFVPMLVPNADRWVDVLKYNIKPPRRTKK